VKAIIEDQKPIIGLLEDYIIGRYRFPSEVKPSVITGLFIAAHLILQVPSAKMFALSPL
jgi:hypothetical protein